MPDLWQYKIERNLPYGWEHWSATWAKRGQDKVEIEELLYCLGRVRRHTTEWQERIAAGLATELPYGEVWCNKPLPSGEWMFPIWVRWHQTEYQLAAELDTLASTPEQPFMGFQQQQQMWCPPLAPEPVALAPGFEGAKLKLAPAIISAPASVASSSASPEASSAFSALALSPEPEAAASSSSAPEPEAASPASWQKDHESLLAIAVPTSQLRMTAEEYNAWCTEWEEASSYI